ncbi:hypothetical protein CMO93_01570 [Candidatus Woesearchaeota archaeon]|nr:hypothetical protein [Candidatus Woesearchaeota archaeon]|tara:strand:+ start:702 stop:1190 length:489 start_codon:yes stop_codon:yes gene_type:complete
MGFIRIKKINGKEYAYLVENRWYKRGFKSKGKGSRQKVGKYLGRVYFFEKTNDADFLNFKKIDNFEEYIINNNQDDIINDLVRWEMFKHNIDATEFNVNFNNKKIMKGNKEVSLRLNEGFLNSYTLRRLFNLKKEDSYYLAKCFVEAGVKVPKEVFVGLFSE